MPHLHKALPVIGKRNAGSQELNSQSNKTKRMKKLILLIILGLNVQILLAQTPYSKEVLEQIKQVENHLAGEVKIVGEKDYNILDRMEFYKVKGLSIAVIKNYK